MIREKRINKYILIIQPSIPSQIDFQTILMPKVVLAKILSEKAGPLEPLHSFLEDA